MGKLYLAFFFFISLALAAVLPGANSSRLGSWARRLDSVSGKVSTLQFYLHDTISGNSPSAVQVVKPVDTGKSSTRFGAIFMADDPLTEGPDPSSKLLGRAQGLYGLAGQTQASQLMAMTFYFTGGDYSGSSFGVLGQISPTSPVSEIPVTGGTGLFRSASGYAIVNTYSVDATSRDAVLGYNVTVHH
uniref:Dirigent protein n=1 Tax=Rhizophora mucronata TaxID=61149 RepID=A0A2P2PRG3_RHIMU